MKIAKTELLLKQGDITEETVDAVVNAANSGLMGGGGVDGAIHRVGGPSILEECKEIRQRQGRCSPGNAVATRAGDLKASYVIHAVGPIWSGGNKGEAETLRNVYRNSLVLAAEKGARSISFPSISTGAYRYPIGPAAHVALSTCIEYAQEESQFLEIRFVLFSEKDRTSYQRVLAELVESGEK